MSRSDRITASPGQTATGPWDGVGWDLETMNEQTLQGTIIKFDLGRLRKTSRGLLLYEVMQITERSRTSFSVLLEYDLSRK